MRYPQLCLLLALGSLVGLFASPVTAQSTSAARAGAGPQFVQPPSGFDKSCRRYDWLCGDAPDSPSARTEGELLDIARSVNRRVNGMISQLSDVENYGVSDRWTLPRNGRGDCEDFALLKYKLLVEAGVDSRKLAIAVALDRYGDNHAVLVVRHESGDLVLDNLTSRIDPWNETGYRFLAMQNSEDQTAWEVVANRPPSSAMLARR